MTPANMVRISVTRGMVRTGQERVTTFVDGWIALLKAKVTLNLFTFFKIKYLGGCATPDGD